MHLYKHFLPNLGEEKVTMFRVVGYAPLVHVVRYCLLQYDNKKELPRITLPQRMVQKIERSIRKKASNKHQQMQHHRGPVIISCKKKSLNHRKGQTYSNFNPNHLASGNWKSPRSKSDFFTINATQGVRIFHIYMIYQYVNVM